MRKLLVAFVCAALSAVSAASAQEYSAQDPEYVVPPSDSTSSSAPVISDAAMMECVRIYNEAKWIADEIDGAQVDQYSEVAVNAHNAKVARHRSMTDAFNRDCAGKQSESAYQAAQKLNASKLAPPN